jgi:dipeptidyl aminopeptidase/acylaminoacyl peptidase
MTSGAAWARVAGVKPRFAPALLLPLVMFAACEPAQPDVPPQATGKPTTEVPPGSATATATAQATAAPAAPLAKVDPDVPAGADAARDSELRKQAEGIVATFTNAAPVFTPDNAKVVFVSNRDGLPQLYLGDVKKPDAAPLRLITTTERVDGPFLTPDGKSVVYRSDKGANESWSIFRVDLDGKNPVELTPGEDMQRDAPRLADKASPPAMVYSGRLVSEAKSRVVVQEITPGAKPRTVYTHPSVGFVVDVSRDGKQALFEAAVSASEQTLSVLDLTTGTLKLVYPPAGKKVNIFDSAFSADGSRIFFGTDEGGSQSVVVAHDIATGKETARYVEGKTPSASLFMTASRDGKTLAMSVGAGDHSELRLLDAKTLKLAREIAMPLGAGFLWRFSGNEKSVGIVWGTANVPGDIFAADVATGKVTPLRKETHAGLSGLAPVSASVTSITSFDGGKVPVNVYLPAEVARTPKPTPVIVSIHGGPAGVSTVGWSAFRRFWTAQGYVLIEPNVRGSSGFGRAYEMADNGPKRMDGIKDFEAVARWALTQPWADKDRMVIYGGSYGGYSVLMGLTQQPALWRAGVNLFGVSHWGTFMKATSGLIREIFLEEIGHPDKDAALLESLSPLKDVGKIKAPLFVYAGANDIRVPRSESDQVVKSLRDRKVPVEYMVAANEGHSLARKENQLEFLSRSARFLEKALGKK